MSALHLKAFRLATARKALQDRVREGHLVERDLGNFLDDVLAEAIDTTQKQIEATSL